MVQYVGVAVGLCAVLFIYPRALALQGLIQVLIAAAQLLVPIAMLGSYALAIRYYPTFRDERPGAKGLLTVSVGLATLGFAIVLLTWPWLRSLLIDHLFGNRPAEDREYLPFVLPLVALIAFGRLFAQYAVNFQRIVVPTLLEQFAFKLVLPALALLYIGGYLSTQAVVYATLGHYALVLVGLVAYVAWLGQFALRRIGPEIRARKGEMAEYAGYSIASHISNGLAFQIDILLVGAFLGLEAAGQYTLVRFMAEVIAKPLSDLRSVTSGLVSQAWARHDLPYLQNLYRKSSDSLLLISGYLFAGILVCYPALAQVASRGEVLATAFSTFALLGVARLIDAATSINDNLIIYSSRYRFNLIALAFLALVSLAANAYLIPLYGLAGAGLAMVIAIGLYNLAKVLFAGFTFGLWPFGKTSWQILLALGLCGGAAWMMPLPPIWWLEIALRGGLLTVLLGLYVWFGRPSEELRGLMQKTFRLAG